MVSLKYPMKNFAPQCSVSLENTTLLYRDLSADFGHLDLPQGDSGRPRQVMLTFLVTDLGR